METAQNKLPVQARSESNPTGANTSGEIDIATRANGDNNRMPEYGHQIHAVATPAGFIRAGERLLLQQKKDAAKRS